MTRQNNRQIYAGLAATLLMVLIAHSSFESAANVEPVPDTILWLANGFQSAAAALVVFYNTYSYMKQTSDLPVREQLQQWTQQHTARLYLTGIVAGAILLVVHVRAVFAGGIAAFEGKPVLNLIVALTAAIMSVTWTREWRKIRQTEQEPSNDPQRSKR